MKLHFAPNTVSIAVAIALEEAGVDFTPVPVDFANAAQTKPAYLAINPKGRVPALETPDGILTETGAILEYACPALVPADPLAAARMRELMFYIAGTFHVNHAHKGRPYRWADKPESHADMQAKVPETVGASCAYLEQQLTLAPFAFGAQITAADPYLFMPLHWLPGDGVAIADYPKLAAFYAMMNDRPSVQAVRAKGMLT